MAFVVQQNALLSSLCLMLGGLLSLIVMVAQWIEQRSPGGQTAN